MKKKRCGWVKLNEPVYVTYHDDEWGKPLHDERALFELFSLETQSAGLSWLTVLKKREAYREVFDNFNLKKVAAYTEKDVRRIMQNGKVIKHKAKIEAIITNAKAFKELQNDFTSIDNYFWSKVKHHPIVNDIKEYKNVLTSSDISDATTKELKMRGFKFIGSITIYAFMQACGMINDHENDCFCKEK